MVDDAAFDRWFDVLPTYPQTKLHLHDETGYCCLGVLVELEEGPNTWRGRDAGASFSTKNGNSTFPSDAENAKYGFDKVMKVTKLIGGELKTSPMLVAEFLAYYNDYGYSFDFIRRLAATYRGKGNE